MKNTLLMVAAITLASLTLAGCADINSSTARPGDYASNYFSAPMSSLYPGNYPQSAQSSISSR